MSDPLTVTAIVATFLIAGAIKGVIGLGPPTVSLALLTVAIGVPQAMALLLVPSFVTNVWQAAIAIGTSPIGLNGPFSPCSTAPLQAPNDAIANANILLKNNALTDVGRKQFFCHYPLHGKNLSHKFSPEIGTLCA